MRVRDAVFLLSNYSRVWDELTSVYSEVSYLLVFKSNVFLGPIGPLVVALSVIMKLHRKYTVSEATTKQQQLISAAHWPSDVGCSLTI